MKEIVLSFLSKKSFFNQNSPASLTRRCFIH